MKIFALNCACSMSSFFVSSSCSFTSAIARSSSIVSAFGSAAVVVSWISESPAGALGESPADAKPEPEPPSPSESFFSASICAFASRCSASSSASSSASRTIALGVAFGVLDPLPSPEPEPPESTPRLDLFLLDLPSFFLKMLNRPPPLVFFFGTLTAFIRRTFAFFRAMNPRHTAWNIIAA